MRRVTAVLDACVLYPAPLRDFLLRLSAAGLFHARWTERIHEEWIRNVLENRPDLTRARLERTRDLMNTNIDDSLVEGYETLMDGLILPDPDDRHVLAAAIHSDASVIVTFNRKDFPDTFLVPHGRIARHPDDFTQDLFHDETEKMLRTVKQHRQDLQNPPKTAIEYLTTLERCGLNRTVALLRPFSEQI